MTLIARLTAATGPSRELDARIAVACGAVKLTRGRDQYVFGDSECHNFLQGPWRGEDDAYAALSKCSSVKHYTASIDAALTLKPADANCHGYALAPHGVDAYVSRNNVDGGHWLYEGEHKTSAALALCIAALKARKVTT